VAQLIAGSGHDHQVLLVPQQYATLQAAIDAVSGPATILVAPGLYAESLHLTDLPYLVIQSTHLTRRGVTLAGNGGSAVIRAERSTLHLSGIEVRSNGRQRGVDVAASNLSFQDCIVAGNRVDAAVGEPGGAGLRAVDSKLRIQKTAIIGNVIDAGDDAGRARGAGIDALRCQIEIAGCTIQANALYSRGPARGAGMYCEAGTLRLWRSRVTDNALHASNAHGGGIHFAASLGAQLGGSVITGNGGPDVRGGGVFIDGDPAAVNIHRNTVVRQNHPNDVESATALD